MTTRAEVRQMMEAAIAADTRLTAEALVEAAKDAKAWPNLNRHLWQVPEAELATEARVARAHRLLITMTITSEDGITTRAYLHTQGNRGYTDLRTVLASPDLAVSKLMELRHDITRARARLNAFRAVIPEDVAAEIDTALEAAEKRTQAATGVEEPATSAA